MTNNFDMSFIDRVTLKEYSLFKIAREMIHIDERTTQSYNAMFNRITQGLEGKSSIYDIYDPMLEQLSLFNQNLDDCLTKEEKATSDMIFNWNKELEKGG